VGAIGNQERTMGWKALPEQKLATRRGSLQVRADERERRTLNVQEDADDGGDGELDGHEWRTSMTAMTRGCSTCSTRRLTKLSKRRKLRRFREERASGDEGSGGGEEGRSSRVAVPGKHGVLKGRKEWTGAVPSLRFGRGSVTIAAVRLRKMIEGRWVGFG
jgi:hypothetical protein